MKILLANKFFYQKAGAETVFFQERYFLKSSGIEVVDFSMQDDRNLPSTYAEYFVKNRDYRSKENGILTNLSAAKSLVYSGEAVERIAALIQKEKPDILHCHNIYHQLTPSIMRAAKRLGVRVVLTLHDYKVVCPVYTRLSSGKPCDACLGGHYSNVVWKRCAEGSLAKSFLLYVEAVFQSLSGSYEAVDKVIVPSLFMYDAVTRARFPANRVSLVYNGIDTSSYAAVEHHDNNYILYLGRLSEEKGLMTLGQAQAGTDMRVVVAGTGPLESTLRHSFRHMEFVGHQSGDALKKLLANAAAVVVPSEWYENCPMSVLEAMAAGKPIIGSRIGGIPELVLDHENGLLFPAGDHLELRRCMQQLIVDEGLRKKMGRAGRARAEKYFSIGNHNNKLLKLYQSLA